jgi:NADPH:quinone reductase-like Zn-dependent oxidoreductase
MVLSAGADRVIDYSHQDFTTDVESYDLIFDLIGNHSLAARRRVLKPHGRCVVGGGPSGRWQMGLMRGLRAFLVSRFVSQTFIGFIAKPNKKDLTELANLAANGRLKPIIGRQYQLSEIADAIRYIETGHAQGKVVIPIAN